VTARARLLMRVTGFALIILAVVLTIYGAVALTAFREAQQDQAESVRQALEVELARQLELATADVAAGNLELALLRLEWILEREPDYAGARPLQAQAQAALDGRQTPDASVSPSPTAAPAAATAGPEDLAPLERLVAQEAWPEAIDAILAFQAARPTFERAVTDALLFESYLQLGLSLLPGDQVEQGIFYLNRAERLAPLPAEARDQRLWAELFLQGMAYYGVDWGTAAAYFRDLCPAAPFFHDACQILYETLIAGADQYTAKGEWCPAEKMLIEAFDLQSSSALGERISEAQNLCLQATPTPTAGVPVTPTPTAGLPVTPTLTLTPPPP
jgi:hypothetical protein